MTSKPNSVPVPPPTKPPSLKTIANHLGLSTAAVSRVLSNSPAAKSIPLPTQQKILAAARLFDYRPNVLARSLRSRRTFTLGVMVPELSEGYATLVLSGIEQRLLEAGFFYFVVSHHHRPELIERYQQLLLDRAIEGLIAIDTPLATRTHVPTVTVSGHHEPPGVTNIQLNHRRAAALAIGHLQALHHTRIAFIKGQQFSSDTRPRWNAIRAAMAAAGIPIDPALVSQLEGEAPTHSPGYQATQRLLAAKRVAPKPGAPGSTASPSTLGIIPEDPTHPSGYQATQRLLAAKHVAPKPGAPGSTASPSTLGIIPEDPTHPSGYQATQRLLAAKRVASKPGAPGSTASPSTLGIIPENSNQPQPFTALFAFNDISAIGAIRALREANLRVPEDVSVIGFDDVQSAAFQNPGLTTVRQPLHEMGILAAQTVLDQIQSPPPPTLIPRHINRTVEPELILRGSTATAHP